MTRTVLGLCQDCGRTIVLHAKGRCNGCYSAYIRMTQAAARTACPVRTVQMTAAERAARNGDLAAWTYGAADTGPAWSPATWALAKQLVPPDRALPGKPAAPALPPKARYRCGPVRWARLLGEVPV